MTFEELVLHNFGVYRGRQSLQLSPKSPSRPVVLIGGLNGRGKTTILDAIQLALYGKLANCSNRGSLSYEEYLARSTNRGTSLTEGAAVELSFSIRHRGEVRRYQVRRAWSQRSTRVRETLTVHVDGDYDPVLSESWAEHVETLIPSGIAPLFMFDGEKIEQLADPASSSEILRTAVHGLLGLDHISQVHDDLKVIEVRRRKDVADDEIVFAVSRREELLASLQVRRTELVNQRASLETTRGRVQRDISKAEGEFKRRGGALLSKTQEIEDQLKSIRDLIREKEEGLRETASGLLPLALVAGPIHTLRLENDRQQRALAQRIALEILSDRDEQVLELIRSLNGQPEVSKQVDAFLVEDRLKRAENSGESGRRVLSQSDALLVRELSSERLDRLRSESASIRDDLDRARAELAQWERRAVRVPRPEDLEEVIKSRDALREDLESCDGELASIDGGLAENRRSQERAQEELARLLGKSTSEAYEKEDVSRVILHAERSRSTLSRFRDLLLRQHVRRLETYILESFRHLVEKGSLVKELSIDAETFAIRLTSAQDGEVGADRLSAGERQLLATAILWGLARASGRAIPTAVDTPLGRLDSTHRQNMIQRYFPSASHQVLLLSTDEEIVGDYYLQLRPRISHSYILRFDEASGCSSISRGYFEEA